MPEPYKTEVLIMTQNLHSSQGLPARQNLSGELLLNKGYVVHGIDVGLLSLIPRESTTFTKTHTSMIGISFFITGYDRQFKLGTSHRREPT